MTESEWMTQEDPSSLLYRLAPWQANTTFLSERKFYLIAGACCRQFWDTMADPRSRAAVEMTERFAEGEADEAERAGAAEEASAACRAASSERMDGYVRAAAWAAVSGTRGIGAACMVCRYLCGGAYGGSNNGGGARRELELRLGRLIRDVAGNPFRPVAFSPGWWTPTAFYLATTAYTERESSDGHLDPARLAVLSDALEEAGCDNPEILSHLRGLGPHVRGCWAVDLVLGRQ